MTSVCPICDACPGAHSFKFLGEKLGFGVFYTCPAQASMYNDREGIIEHYTNALAAWSPRPWVWILDAEGFSLKHAAEVTIAIELSKLIENRYSANLLKIEVVNANKFLWTILECLRPFLSEGTKQKLVIKK